MYIVFVLYALHRISSDRWLLLWGCCALVHTRTLVPALPVRHLAIAVAVVNGIAAATLCAAGLAAHRTRWMLWGCCRTAMWLLGNSATLGMVIELEMSWGSVHTLAVTETTWLTRRTKLKAVWARGDRQCSLKPIWGDAITDRHVGHCPVCIIMQTINLPSCPRITREVRRQQREVRWQLIVKQPKVGHVNRHVA